MPTLPEYLTKPNLEVNRTSLQSGPNSFSIGNYEVEGVQLWADFTLEKALDCFGDILRADIPGYQMHLPAPISKNDLSLTDESSVDAILKKHNHVIVDRALQLGHSRLEGRCLHLPVSWSWGSLSHIEEDPEEWRAAREAMCSRIEARDAGWKTCRSSSWVINNVFEEGDG